MRDPSAFLYGWGVGKIRKCGRPVNEYSSRPNPPYPVVRVLCLAREIPWGPGLFTLAILLIGLSTFSGRTAVTPETKPEKPMSLRILMPRLQPERPQKTMLSAAGNEKKTKPTVKEKSRIPEPEIPDKRREAPVGKPRQAEADLETFTDPVRSIPAHIRKTGVSSRERAPLNPSPSSQNNFVMASAKNDPVGRGPASLQEKRHGSLEPSAARHLPGAWSSIHIGELGVCVDPEAEYALRARLAELLDEPASCDDGDFLFRFSHVRTAYSLDVKINGPGTGIFKDRCAALQAAIQCLQQHR